MKIQSVQPSNTQRVRTLRSTCSTRTVRRTEITYTTGCVGVGPTIGRKHRMPSFPHLTDPPASTPIPNTSDPRHQWTKAVRRPHLVRTASVERTVLCRNILLSRWQSRRRWILVYGTDFGWEICSWYHHKDNKLIAKLFRCEHRTEKAGNIKMQIRSYEYECDCLHGDMRHDQTRMFAVDR
jgi:hypothetical protein